MQRLTGQNVRGLTAREQAHLSMASLSIVWIAVAVTLLFGLALTGQVKAATSDIRNTKHNLSKNAPSTNTVKADTEDQVCVFCHTPHAATAGVNPLWNRSVSTTGYTRYTSSSLDANSIADGYNSQPAGSSVLCLSCHDGQVALGNVNVLNGRASSQISVNGSTTTKMPAGSGTNTGFTRNLGTDLTNDHPISITYNDALADADGELARLTTTAPAQRDTGTGGTLIGIRTSGYKPKLPLQATGAGGLGQVQCGTCHDPHITKDRFLRLNRLQANAGPTGTFSEANDIICLACHEKGGTAWAYSAHANSLVADEIYKNSGTPNPTTLRGFPANTAVWQASCLNCHDSHATQSARKLLREGTDSTANPKTGGNPALEQTCYQCHSSSAESILTSVTQVPNIKADFSLAIRMPITSIEQAAGSEQHDIGGNFNDTATGGPNCSVANARCGKDFIESQVKLGKGPANVANRHAECTDCHNPHRVIKNRLFNANPVTPDAAGTHSHDNATAPHTNLLSGVLKGAWGVEPVYSSTAFGSAGIPSSFTVKKGVPPVNGATDVGQTYATREYQICYKCHSNYAYDDNGQPQSLNTLPALGGAGRTPSGTNGLLYYTNQAMEFQAPVGDRGEPGGNHRSWHPVMDITERTTATRGGASPNLWLLPWRNNSGANIGNQTMQCSDCHGSSTANGTAVPTGGEDGNPWGPHGSSNNFLLKGGWSINTGNDTASGIGTPGDLCFKCHDWNQYAQLDGTLYQSGWNDNSSKLNLHKYHNGRVKQFRCRLCHVAVVHGWKNKAFLVNLNDVGPEVMCRSSIPGKSYGDPKITSPSCTAGQPIPAGTRICRANPSKPNDPADCSVSEPYTNPPYYNEAVLQIATWTASNTYQASYCGSGPSNNGPGWMGSACDSVK